MEKLFVLAGKARSGKDSACEFISDYYKDKKVIKFSCTLYLKDYISKVYGWNGSEDSKPRDILQNMGNQIRDIYPDIFVRRMEEDIKVLQEYCDIMIITGVRLVKELEFLKGFGAVCIKVCSDGENGLSRIEKNDITELEVDKFNDYDYIIKNEGSLDDLRMKVIDICEEC